MSETKKPAKAEKIAPTEISVVATSPIEHDGQAFAIGDELTLPVAAAEALIAAGAARAKG